MLRLLFPEQKGKLKQGEKQIAGLSNINHQSEGIQFKR